MLRLILVGSQAQLKNTINNNSKHIAKTNHTEFFSLFLLGTAPHYKITQQFGCHNNAIPYNLDVCLLLYSGQFYDYIMS